MPTAPPIPIFHVHGVAVILDADLARLYGVATRSLNQAVKRNANRFPDDFRFRLSPVEYARLTADSGAAMVNRSQNQWFPFPL